MQTLKNYICENSQKCDYEKCPHKIYHEHKIGCGNSCEWKHINHYKEVKCHTIKDIRKSKLNKINTL